MRLSRYYLNTHLNSDSSLRTSHRLALQAGLVKQIESGIYSILPFGQYLLNNIINVIKEELDKINFMECSLPSLQPLSLWEQRINSYGEEMFKINNNNNDNDNKYCLGPTAEELAVETFNNSISSYKQLPLTIYQLSNKYRNELRPEGGLIRTKEFLMKDAYSFHLDNDCLNNTYNQVLEAYKSIFNRLGLNIKLEAAEAGEIGGNESLEFYVNDIEVGHIFKLGTKYSNNNNNNNKFSIQDKNNKLINPVMGCYGIGVTRLLFAIIEQNHDSKGIIWPYNLLPFKGVIIPIGEVEVPVIEGYALDDRDIPFGAKLKDADLLGFKTKLITSQRLNISNQYEIEDRDGNKSFISKSSFN